MSNLGLQFEYCECGCHGHEASAGKVHYWIYNDLRGNFFLHKGHGWTSPKMGSFGSFDAAERAANEDVKNELQRMLSDLSKPTVPR